MFRYMALIWNAASVAQTETADLIGRRLRALSPQWREAMDHDGMRVLCAHVQPGSLEPHMLADDSGVVLGTLFERNHEIEDGSPARRANLNAHQTHAVVASRGRTLLENYWGNYVAFIAERGVGCKLAIKDPTGNLPCFSTHYRGVTIVFSCIADCIGLQLLSFNVDRAYLAGRLVAGGGGHEHSSLAEISQVYRGQCLAIDTTQELPTVRREFLWTPLRFPHSESLLEDPQGAARAMRATIRAATHSLAGCHDSLLLRLSGGLDSSIIAGCLKDAPAGPRVACYTHFNPRGRSDERPWARLVTAHTGFEHIEHAVVPEDLDLAAALQMPPAVEPASALEFLQRTALEKNLTADRAATAVFTGDGGDSGFCSDSVDYALSEHLHQHGLSLAMLRLAAQIALLTEQSTWTVLLRSLRRWRAGGDSGLPRSLPLSACRLVRPDVVASVTAARQHSHPWFRNAQRVPGGMLRRVGMLVATPDIYNASPAAHDTAPEIVSPLYAQPVVELLLRIPIHTHFENGRDRGLARRAFTHEVPDAILERRWKDRAPGFHDELIHRNRAFLRELFLDGVLVGEGLLDRKAVDTALSAGPVKNNVFPGEILSHMGTEIWARQWLSGTQRRAVA